MKAARHLLQQAALALVCCGAGATTYDAAKHFTTLRNANTTTRSYRAGATGAYGGNYTLLAHVCSLVSAAWR